MLGVWSGILTTVIWLCLERVAVDSVGGYSTLVMIDRCRMMMRDYGIRHR